MEPIMYIAIALWLWGLTDYQIRSEGLIKKWHEEHFGEL